jgi:hypothetical protein
MLAIATWESKNARDEAMKKLKEANAKTDFHSQFGDIEVLGFFEEIDRVELSQL